MSEKEEGLLSNALRRKERRLEANLEAENAPYWMGKIKSADRLLYGRPVNKSAAKMIRRK